MRPEIEAMLRQLLARNESVIALDTVGEVIGAERISQDEIELLFTKLQQAGKAIGAPTSKVRLHLAPVLAHARRLKQERQGTPNVSEIAAATGLSVAEVRAALLFASVMGR